MAAAASHDGVFEPSADEFLARNTEFAASFDNGGLAVAPQRKLAIVACMDSRMDIFEMLGLANGEAHVVRNAGGACRSASSVRVR